ncbi:MAG: hypothetical protein DBX55_10375 [Verrucomicrobia bacterium]|nr:MAG: hypothetical protein DBX55_10375 [Verrucomicrobiota bacterium]
MGYLNGIAADYCGGHIFQPPFHVCKGKPVHTAWKSASGNPFGMRNFRLCKSPPPGIFFKRASARRCAYNARAEICAASRVI